MIAKKMMGLVKCGGPEPCQTLCGVVGTQQGSYWHHNK
jgi:hypothetical protein